MKQLLRMCCVCLSLSLLAASATAASFYQNQEGEIIMEITNRNEAERLLALADENFQLPDAQELLEGEEDKPLTPKAFSEQDFNVAQSKLVAFVRELNWKTGFNLTLRDANLFKRLKMVVSAATLYTQPMRVNLSTVYPDLENQLTKLEDELMVVVQEYATASTFDKAIQLSTLGLRYTILTDKPFILLFLDEGQYKELVALDKRLHPEEDSAIETLANNLYTFFAYRAVYMEDKYNKNTEKLIYISEMGKGDAQHTWEKLAEFAARMYAYNATNDLDPEQEAKVHIPRLEFAMRRVKHDLKVEKKAAKMAYQDPANAALVKEINDEGPKRPTLEQEARQLLQRSTQAEIKEMILKHCIK